MSCGGTGLVLGVADGGVPVWELVSVPLMANVLTTRRFPPREHWGRLWVDSGGYQALRRGVRVSVDWVVERFRGLEARFFVMLDSPPVDGVGDRGDAERNLRLFEELYSRLEDRTVVPVVHHYDVDSLVWLVERYESYGPPVLAVGGSVPGLLNRGKKKAATLVYLALVRRLWRGWLHVLGAGSPVMRCILGVLGVDTADTATWKAKAAYGKVLVPGAGERYVGSRRIRYGALYASGEDLERLRRFLVESGFPLEVGLEELLGSFRGRALVNAWVLVYGPVGVGRGYRWMYRLARFAAGLDFEGLVGLHERALRSQRVRFLVEEVSLGLA